VLEESSVIFGLVRKSRYEELQKQMDELKAYMKILNSDMEKLQKESRELRNEVRLSKQKVSQLQGEANNLRFQREELANYVEILTKERGIFQQIIQSLSQSTRKQKHIEP
jgi:predicted nuclease with TOPRIM domain